MIKENNNAGINLDKNSSRANASLHSVSSVQIDFAF